DATHLARIVPARIRRRVDQRAQVIGRIDLPAQFRTGFRRNADGVLRLLVGPQHFERAAFADAVSAGGEMSRNEYLRVQTLRIHDRIAHGVRLQTRRRYGPEFDVGLRYRLQQLEHVGADFRSPIAVGGHAFLEGTRRVVPDEREVIVD